MKRLSRPARFAGIAAAVLFGVVSSGITNAHAQGMPSMDLSWGMRTQNYMWNWGNQQASNAFWTCYNYSRMMRARGYYGPIDCGANAQTLQNSVNRLNNQYQANARAWERNSWITQQAQRRAGQAITGQTPTYNCRWFPAYGQWYC